MRRVSGEPLVLPLEEQSRRIRSGSALGAAGSNSLPPRPPLPPGSRGLGGGRESSGIMSRRGARSAEGNRFISSGEGMDALSGRVGVKISALASVVGTPGGGLGKTGEAHSTPLPKLGANVVSSSGSGGIAVDCISNSVENAGLMHLSHQDLIIPAEAPAASAVEEGVRGSLALGSLPHAVQSCSPMGGKVNFPLPFRGDRGKTRAPCSSLDEILRSPDCSDTLAKLGAQLSKLGGVADRQSATNGCLNLGQSSHADSFRTGTAANPSHDDFQLSSLLRVSLRGKSKKQYSLIHTVLYP